MPTPKYNIVGASGLEFQSGVVREEFLTELTGPRGMKVYRAMRDNDPVIGGMLFSMKTMARRAEWSVEPGGDTPADEENAKYVWDCLNDMEQPWGDTVVEIMSFLEFGWSLQEVVFKIRRGPQEKNPKFKSAFTDGKIGWRGFMLRAQESLENWVFDNDGNATAMVQRAAPDFRQLTVDLQKSLLFRTQRYKGNPEGRSILRNAYVPWYRKSNIEQIEGIGIERELTGLANLYLPPEVMASDATPDQKAFYEYCKKIIRNIRMDEQAGLIWPMIFDSNNNQMVKFELVNSGGRRNFDTTAIITRYDQRIAMSVLADFLLIGHESVGSFALSSSKTHMFSLAGGTYLDIIADEINKNAIPDLLLFNGVQPERYPRLVPGDVETISLLELGSYVARLSGAGMALFPDENLEAYLRGQAGMPRVRGEEAVSLFEMQDVENEAEGTGDNSSTAGQTIDRQGRVRGPRNLLSGGDSVRE
jgi:hypothetical protein